MDTQNRDLPSVTPGRIFLETNIIKKHVQGISEHLGIIPNLLNIKDQQGLMMRYLTDVIDTEIKYISCQA